MFALAQKQVKLVLLREEKNDIKIKLKEQVDNKNTEFV